jgi:RHS repeat-associated protein
VEPQQDGSEAVTAYRWDVRDRLREVRLPDGRHVAYRYDAFARRVSKELHAPASLIEDLARALAGEGGAAPEPERTRFLYDGDVLCAELRSEAQGGVRVHVHEARSFAPLLQVERGDVFTVVNDHLGMPKELLDGRGRVAWAAAHSAWGRVVDVQRDDGTAEVSSPFRLLGQYADEETGLCYTRFRYFDAEAGRWCSPDPLGIEGGRNLAAFDGAPTAEVDPLGLCPEANVSPEIRPADLQGKTPDELRQFATDKGLIPHPTKPDKFMDPVTGKERLRLDPGHVDKQTGLPYNDPKAAVPHAHGYGPDGTTKVRDPTDNNPHFPTR